MLSQDVMHYVRENDLQGLETEINSNPGLIDLTFDKHGETPLHAAARLSHADIAVFLVRAGADVNIRDRRRRTPLHHAAAAGSIEILSLLCTEGGAIVEAREEVFATPLMLAVRVRQSRVVSALISVCNADATTRAGDGSPALHWAAAEDDVSTLQVLLAEGKVTISAKGQEGTTAVHAASRRGAIHALEVLCSHACPLEEGDELGRTPLHYAVRASQVSATEFLVHKQLANVSAVDKLGRTPLHYAAVVGLVPLASILINEGDSSSVFSKDEDLRTPLHLAAATGKVDMIVWLVDVAGAELDAFDKNGFPPVHLAAANGELIALRVMIEQLGVDPSMCAEDGSPVHFASIRGGNSSTLEYLCSLTDCSVTDTSGRSGLHVAAMHEKYDIMEWLLEQEINPVDTVDNNGNTPLHYAALAGSQEAARILIARGASMNANAAFGYSPIDAALSGPRVVKTGQTMATNEEFALWLVTQGALVDIPDLDGNTVLRRAAMENFDDFVLQCLALHFADANEVAEDGLSLFHFAIAENKDKLVRSLIHRRLASLTRPTKYGLLPLHVAARAGSRASAKVLIDEDGCIRTTVKGRDARSLAEASGHIELARLLENECGRRDHVDL